MAGYRRPIASLAVLADESENWQPSDFAYQLSGCTVGICFSIVRFLDYVCQTEALLKDTNAFALVNAAHLFTPAPAVTPNGTLPSGGWPNGSTNGRRRDNASSFSVIGWPMRLRDEMEQRLLEEVRALLAGS
jgi:hypothetical protein